MVEKSQLAREEVEEHNAAFEEAHERGDTFSAAFHAMDALAAKRRADELQRIEHPELERLDLLNSRLKEVLALLSQCTYFLAGIIALLCVIAYKLF